MPTDSAIWVGTYYFTEWAFELEHIVYASSLSWIIPFTFFHDEICLNLNIFLPFINRRICWNRLSSNIICFCFLIRICWCRLIICSIRIKFVFVAADSYYFRWFMNTRVKLLQMWLLRWKRLKKKQWLLK